MPRIGLPTSASATRLSAMICRPTQDTQFSEALASTGPAKGQRVFRAFEHQAKRPDLQAQHSFSEVAGLDGWKPKTD